MKMNSLLKRILDPFDPRIAIILIKNRRRKNMIKEWGINGYPIENNQILDWQKNGDPINPPHLVKQIVIQEYQKKLGQTTFIETGTYLGDMVEAQKMKFKKIISIELGFDLYEKAKFRFRNDKNVIILQGDSGKVLPEIMKEIDEPAIFWLDGHYSEGITARGDKECPIFEELDAILNSKKLNHTLLIDDARCFNGKGDYPSIKYLTKYIKNKNEKYKVVVKYDIIRYVI
jgi:hypothetical protein